MGWGDAILGSDIGVLPLRSGIGVIYWGGGGVPILGLIPLGLGFPYWGRILGSDIRVGGPYWGPILGSDIGVGGPILELIPLGFRVPY